MPKIAKNLSLDAELVARAERYGARHGMTLSHLVNRYFAALPDEEVEVARPQPDPSWPPPIRRLWEIAQSGPPVPPDTDYRAIYREHLERKYLHDDGGGE